MMRLLRLSLLSLSAAPALAQTTWHVDASAVGPGTGSVSDPFPSIQTAIDQPATVDGDTVLVHPGTYTELVDLLDKELLLLSSSGPSVTTIDVALQFSVEQSAIKIRGGQGPACRVEGFSLVGGEGTFVTEPVLGIQLFAGGGLFVVDSSPTIVNCILRDNEPSAGGGAFVVNGQPLFEDCMFLDNSTVGPVTFGAGLHASVSQVTLRDVVMRGNKASGDGGAVHLFGGALTVEGGALAGNWAHRGGNLALRSGATADVIGAAISKGICSDGDGGGVWLDGGAASFEGCTFHGNRAGYPSSNRAGGAIAAIAATLELNACTLSDNYSARGGAVFLGDSLGTITASTFQDNECEGGSNWFYAEGGALAASNSSVSVFKCVFSANLAVSRSPAAFGPIARGGALWCDTPLVQVSHCSFTDNEAFYDSWADPTLSKPEPGAQGGAIFGPAQVKRSRLIGNRAYSDPSVLIGRAEGGGAWGAALVGSLLQANEVAGIGPVPDVGPAAEACALTCCVLVGNLPASLPPLGPLCSASCP